MISISIRRCCDRNGTSSHDSCLAQQSEGATAAKVWIADKILDALVDINGVS